MEWDLPVVILGERGSHLIRTLVKADECSWFSSVSPELMIFFPLVNIDMLVPLHLLSHISRRWMLYLLFWWATRRLPQFQTLLTRSRILSLSLLSSSEDVSTDWFRIDFNQSASCIIGKESSLIGRRVYSVALVLLRIFTW